MDAFSDTGSEIVIVANALCAMTKVDTTVIIRTTRHRVSKNVVLARLVVDHEVVLRELRQPARHALEQMMALGHDAWWSVYMANVRSPNKYTRNLISAYRITNNSLSWTGYRAQRSELPRLVTDGARWPCESNCTSEHPIAKSFT